MGVSVICVQKAVPEGIIAKLSSINIHMSILKHYEPVTCFFTEGFCRSGDMLFLTIWKLYVIIPSSSQLVKKPLQD